YVKNTLDKDNTDSVEKALVEIYERLRPGEPPTLENVRNLLISRFFDPKRYDLAHVGRYKINKKLHLKNRLFNQRLAETLVGPETGEVLAEEGQILERRLLDRILPYLDKGLNEVTYTPYGGILGDEPIKLQVVHIYAPGDENKVIKVIGNGNIDKSVRHITPAD